MPEGSSSLWIELAPDDQADDFVFFVRYNQAVELYNKNDFKGAEPLLKKVVEGQGK